ncbi:MAG TPA: glycoside hydrolase family 5 protein [Sphingomicrobium sp.]|nr:glycoside hydrolase family 5 protein [Sphingomicrobium sp.]
MGAKAAIIFGLLVSAASAAFVVSSDKSGTSAATPPTRLPMMGVNLASGEFAPERLPGVYDKDYTYPGARTAEPFLRMGMNTVRLPVRWERLQHQPLAPLDQAEMRRLDRSIQQLGGFQTIILDLHNYGRYHGALLEGAGGAAMLADFWTRIAQHYGRSPKIAFGIMNEPHDLPAPAWRAIVDQTVAAIRRTGARNLLLIPGTRWTGAHSWMSGGSESNAAAFQDFRDPGRNFLFEVHQYLDWNSAGTSKSCAGAKVGSRRLEAFTRWSRQRGARALLGEFGSSADPTCLAALDDMLRYMSRNADVWAGWTYWAGGDWWGDYSYSIQPGAGGAPRPQAQVLKRYLAMP